MKKNFVHLTAVFMSGIFLVTGVCASKLMTVKAETLQSGITLNEEEEIQVQLDGKGAKESVWYTWSEQGFYYNLDLYIDDEKVASFKNSEPDVQMGDVFITNLDTADKVKDIFVLTYGSGSWGKITTLYYCRYENGKFEKVQDLKKYLEKELKSMPEIKKIGCNFHKMQGMEQLFTVMGNGMMGIAICGNSNQIGYFHANLMLKANHKLVELATSDPYGCIIESCAAEYKTIQKGDLPYRERVSFAKLKSNCKFYTMPNRKKTAFTVKKGTTFDSLYFQLVGGKLYIGVDDGQGNTGWIKDRQKSVFKTYNGVHNFN